MVHLLRVSRRLSLCVYVQCYSINVSYWRLEFGHVSLMHTVMSDQLIWAGEFLLTARPVTVKGFLTWRTEQTWHVKVLICNEMNSSRTRVWDKKKVYALVLPVWVRVWVFRWSERENFLSHVSHWKGLTPTTPQRTNTHTLPTLTFY